MDKFLDRYVKRGRLSVQGWLSRGACAMVMAISEAQRLRGVEGNVVEIGVHHGRLFILLLLLTDGAERGLAIDLFEDQEQNADASGEGDYGKLVRNIRRHAPEQRDRFVAHKCNSTELTGEKIKELVGGPVRLFSVDGGHTETITFSDLVVAEAALAPGGVIILDDCFNQAWPGVVSGVLRFYRSEDRSVRPFAIGANKVLFAHHEWADGYREALTRVRARVTHSEFLGMPVACLDLTGQTSCCGFAGRRCGKQSKIPTAARGLRSYTLRCRL